MKLSIITINYNNLEGLIKTFQSVFNQTSRDFEYIVIDGGSTDGSKALIEANSEKIKYWVSEKDTGVYHALNKGIKVANGDFINFMNSGDCFFDKKVIEKIIPLLDNDFGMFYGNTMVSKGIISPPNFIDFNYLIVKGINHQASFFNRNIFEKVFYYNESYKILSDWELLIVAICKYNIKYKKIDEIICVYDENGVSSVNPEIFRLEKQSIFNEHFPAFENITTFANLIGERRFLDLNKIIRHKFSWRIIKSTISFLKLIFRL